MRSFLLLCLLPALLPGQDSLSVDLGEVTVRAYREGATAERTAGSVAVLGRQTILEYPEADLLPALNRIAGVRFEQRAPGSYRVSVRGSTLRSPFGVRNLKVYWNGLPLTEPGGDTQLNFLDVGNVDRLELIKGPAGSLYGAGTAGTLLLSTDTLPHRAMLYADGGSFGSFGARAQVRGGDGAAGWQLRYATRGTDGYRDHSSLFRQTVQYGLRLRDTDEANLRLHALYTDLSYDLPGGLNPEQYAEDPTQARPGSADKNASINYHNLLLGLSHERRWAGWSSESAVYATGFYFDHPFNFDYKRETNLGAGGRTVIDRTLNLYFDRAPQPRPRPRQDTKNSYLKLSLGAEYQLQYRFANNFTNPDASPGELNFSDEIDTRQGLLFGQAVYTTGDWRITAGLSANHLRYTVDRTFNRDGNPGEVTSEFPVALSPRLALLRSFGPVSVYASVADGFSPPTLDEFRTNEGSLNADLAPERGVNYEVGVKAQSGRLRYEAAAFLFRLRESITSFSDDRGTRLFRNAGATEQFGLECSATYRANPWLELYASYTYQDFSYGTFVRDGTDVSGQPLPGSAPHVTNLIADLGRPTGWYANLNWNFTDAIPLNDENTVFGEAYHLLRARLGYRSPRFELFLSASNLLDERMSFGNDLNPRFGNRFFQPAPGMNGAVGGKVNW